MSTISQAPQQYQIYNDLQTKQLAVVVDIEGLDYLTSTLIGRRVQYGDPVYYGDGTLYNGLVPIGLAPGERGQKILLSLEGSSLTISQRLEPEQGRAAISTISMTFVDLDKYMTRAVTRGVIIDEILGKEVKIWLGYPQTSFPEDYYVVWRGRVSQIVPEIGRITLQFSDPNIIKKQQVFFTAKTTLSMSIDGVVDTIPVTANTDFHRKILGPDGLYDQNVKTYLKIDDEFIEYQQTGFEATGFGVNQFLDVVRGSRNTLAASHDVDAGVDSYIELSGHAIDIALKIMLSGWNGPFAEGVEIESLVQTGDVDIPIVNNAIVLPLYKDAIRDYGLTVGTYITISGDPNPANNNTFIVQGFQNSLGQPNKLIIVDGPLIASPATPAVMSFRSQYDVWPLSCGLKMPAWEIDIDGHLYYKNTYLNDLNNSYRFLINSEEAGKTFIESEIMLPIGAYALTRQGKVSMGLTKPPIADDRTVVIDETNVINPENIKVQRGVNNRKFFNEVQWEYDYNDAGNPVNTRKTLDTDSLNEIGLSSVLPISSKGAKTDLGFEVIVERRERFLLNRYALGAVLIDLKTNFKAGNLIEAGDVIILSDQGNLQIPNLSTGDRDMGQQLLEVINRSLDLKSGQVQLTLQGGIGSLVNDRYATISPSSLITTGSTTTKLRITESFGAVFPAQERKKWEDYIGLNIIVHSYDWTTRYGESTILGFDPTDDHAILISPALSFVPQVDDILDIGFYPDNTDPLDQALYKLVHCFLDPTVDVVAGTSNTVFDVALLDAAKFQVGLPILIHNDDYSIFSPEVDVLSVVGTTITVASSLGFTPAAGQKVELIGFKDGGGAYRFV